MTWAAISAAVNATVADHCGEVATLIASGVSSSVHAVIVTYPTAVGDTDAWEPVPTAQIPESEVLYAPRSGDLLIDASGARWTIDRADLSEGMWAMTLRRDPAG